MCLAAARARVAVIWTTCHGGTGQNLPLTWTASGDQCCPQLTLAKRGLWLGQQGNMLVFQLYGPRFQSKD